MQNGTMKQLPQQHAKKGDRHQEAEAVYRDRLLVPIRAW